MRQTVLPAPALVLILCGALLAPASARAAQRTVLTIDPPVPAAPRYSQAISVDVHLALEDGGTAVAGTDCTPACSVIVDVAVAGADPQFLVVNPQGFVTGADGTASARVTFVDGRYEDGSTFPADAEGLPYTIRARFLGSGAGQVPENPDCVAAAVEDANGDFCPSEASTEVSLFLETAAIEPGAGLEGALGDELTLSARLEDPTGEAALGGTAVDGTGELLLIGRSVTFFYDVDNDGNAEASEIVGTAETNAAGVASLAFPLNPDFIRAGTYDNGLLVEFGGDGQYGVARSGARVVVNPADVDVASTIIEVDPPEIPADGFSKSVITVRLIDKFNNPLDETSEPHDVVITTDNGILIDEVELDLLSGVYRQELQAQRKDGAATIRVTVDGEEVPATGTVDIVREGGCTCTSSSGLDTSALLAFAGVTLLVARRVSKSRKR
jgi:hypothetical protein